MQSETRKWYRRGTHRIIAPAETLRRFAAHASELGITRLANVTALDYLGVPVFMAIRPNAQSLSVSQGKGVDEAAASASAFMEAVELEHAERVEWPSTLVSYAALKTRARVADPTRLARATPNRFQPDCEIPWSEGCDIANGERIWVPFELVHTNYTVPSRPGEGFFAPSSNGLASGNHQLEAICAGTCEAIERDATRLWRLRDDDDRATRRLTLGSIRDSDCRAVLDRLCDRGMAVSVWDITTDIGVACFICRLREAPGNTRSRLGAFWGSGCHVSRNVALVRALTEAVQSRLTCIAGSRDDISRKDYAEPPEQALFDLIRDAWEEKRPGRRFQDVPGAVHATVADDVEHLVRKLRLVGLNQVIVVDLTNPRFEIPVVRVIIPGLEADDQHSRRRPGRRARALRDSPR